MIHDVTIPFAFDTSPIEEQIANVGAQEAQKLIEDVVHKGLLSALPKKGSYWAGNPKNEDEIDWKRLVNDRVDEFIESHKDEIVDEAAMLLAMRGSRKKAWREVLDELRAERDAE